MQTLHRHTNDVTWSLIILDNGIPTAYCHWHVTHQQKQHIRNWHTDQHSEKLGSWCSREYSRNSNITEITVVSHQSRNIRVCKGWNYLPSLYFSMSPCTSSQGGGRGWRCPPCPTDCAMGQGAHWDVIVEHSRWDHSKVTQGHRGHVHPHHKKNNTRKKVSTYRKQRSSPHSLSHQGAPPSWGRGTWAAAAPPVASTKER